jgi:hypothetical protein
MQELHKVFVRVPKDGEPVLSETLRDDDVGATVLARNETNEIFTAFDQLLDLSLPTCQYDLD